MSERFDHRVLVPVAILGGESVPETIVEALASLPVVVLGYHEIPDQTATDQARMNYEDQARSKLARLERVFADAGCNVTTRLVFTHDRFKTFERAAVELDCDGVLILNPAPVLEDVLVAIRGDANVEHIAQLTATLLADTTLEVTLLHVVTDEDGGRGAALLDTAAAKLADDSVDPGRVETVVVDGRPTDAILSAAADHDLLVIGESRPSIRRRIFRDRAERLARRTVSPVLVIRGEYLESPAEPGEE